MLLLIGILPTIMGWLNTGGKRRVTVAQVPRLFTIMEGENVAAGSAPMIPRRRCEFINRNIQGGGLLLDITPAPAF